MTKLFVIGIVAVAAYALYRSKKKTSASSNQQTPSTSSLQLPPPPSNPTPDQIIQSSKVVAATLPTTAEELGSIPPPTEGTQLVSVTDSTGKTAVVEVPIRVASYPIPIGVASYPILMPVAIGAPTPTVAQQVQYFTDLKVANQNEAATLNDRIAAAQALLAALNPLTDRYASVSASISDLQARLSQDQQQVSFAQSQLDILARYS